MVNKSQKIRTTVEQLKSWATSVENSHECFGSSTGEELS